MNVTARTGAVSVSAKRAPDELEPFFCGGLPSALNASLVTTKKARSGSRYGQTPPNPSCPNHQVCRSVGNRHLYGTHGASPSRPSKHGLPTREVAVRRLQPEEAWLLSAHSCRTDRNEIAAASPSGILWCSPQPEAGLRAYLWLATSRPFNSASAVAKRAWRL